MKIVLIGPTYPFRGGIAHFTTLLARALGTQHQVCVISFRRQYPAWLYPGRSDRDPSRQAQRIEAEFLLDPLSPATWVRTAKHIRILSPHMVVFQWWTVFMAPCIGVLARLIDRAGIRVIYVVHNVLPHEKACWHRAVTRFALPASASYIVQTESQERLLRSLLPAAQVKVSPHPPYPLPADRRTSKSAARQILGVPPDAFVILFFGFVRAYKGLALLMEAVAELRRSGCNAFLLVAGEFWERKDLHLRRAHALGIDLCIRIEDRYIPNEEVPHYFAAADVLADPHLDGTPSGARQLAVGFGLPVASLEESPDPMAFGTGASRPAREEAVARLAAQLLERYTQRDGQAPNPKSEDEILNAWRRLASDVVRLAGFACTPEGKP